MTSDVYLVRASQMLASFYMTAATHLLLELFFLSSALFRAAVALLREARTQTSIFYIKR
jgi:hypothetical protein